MILKLYFLRSRFYRRISIYFILSLLLCIYFYMDKIDHNSHNTSVPSCKIPLLDPFDDYIRPFLQNLEPLNCPKEQPLSYIENGLLKSAQNNCYYSWLWRENGDLVKYSKPQIIPKHGVYFNEYLFANVSCIQENSKTIYRYIHYFIPLEFKYKKSFCKQSIFSPENISVLILVFESLSNLSFKRFMKQTSNILNNNDFITMKGLTRIGENSFPNSMALLTGYPMSDEEAAENWGTFWDDQIFIWNEFDSHISAFIEDSPLIGLFNYYNRSFNLPPSDFYPFPFWSSMVPSSVTPLQLMSDQSLYCFEKQGSKLEIFLNQIKDFIHQMNSAKKPFFVYAFYEQMTHENYNNFALVDSVLASFFIHSQSFLDNTLIILKGDHGPREGPTVNSPYGYVETSLPFLSVKLPYLLVNKYPHLLSYLKINSNRLTTLLDVRQMLLDLSKGTFNKALSKNTRHYSLFRQEIPFSRTCEQAGINELYCVCDGLIRINENNIETSIAISNLMELLNKLKNFYCLQTLSLKKLIKAFYILPRRKGETFSTIEKMDLRFITRNNLKIRALVYRKKLKGFWSKWKPLRSISSRFFSFRRNLVRKLCFKYKHRIFI